jgi:hypothetical protein
VYVVGEEALVVENVAESLGACGYGHGLSVLVLVHLHNGVETLLQRITICCKADYRKYYPGTLVVWALAADLEELGCVSCVDVVARSGACVAGEDGEVSAGDAEC